jgi:hypothetical protein
VGYSAANKVKGHKIHALVDSEGLPIASSPTPPRSKTVTGGICLDKIGRRFPWLELIWADGSYNNAWQVDGTVAKVTLLRVEIAKWSDDMKGFVISPHLWWRLPLMSFGARFCSDAPPRLSRCLRRMARSGVSPRTS